MAIFTIYYKSDTGEIVSYLESVQLPPEKELPEGCKRLCYDRIVPLSRLPSYMVDVKVDPVTLHLIPINPPKIVTPEMQNVANQPSDVADPNREIKHV